MFDKFLIITGNKLVKTIISMFIVILFFTVPLVSFGEEESSSMLEDIMAPQMESSEMKKFSRNLEESMTEEGKELIPYYSAKQLMEELVRGNIKNDMVTLPDKIINLIAGEIKVNFTLIIKLITIVFLSAFIKNLQGSFKESTVGELAYFSCYAAIVTMIAIGFQSVLEYAGEVLEFIDKITGFAIPSLIALLVSSGNIVSGSALQAVLIFIIQSTVKIFKTVFLPLCFMAGILYIINGLSEKIKISGMASFLKQIVAWGLGGILTIYASIVVIRGAAGSVVDGAAAKTAKTAMSTFIPVAGKYMADAADTIISCALVIKNTAGLAAMIVTVAVCLSPILKIFVIVMMYRFAAAVAEPVAEERFSECLKDVSDCMKTILGVVGAAVFMFLLSVASLLGAGGVSSMMQ